MEIKLACVECGHLHNTDVQHLLHSDTLSDSILSTGTQDFIAPAFALGTPAHPLQHRHSYFSSCCIQSAVFQMRTRKHYRALTTFSSLQTKLKPGWPNALPSWAVSKLPTLTPLVLSSGVEKTPQKQTLKHTHTHQARGTQQRLNPACWET